VVASDPEFWVRCYPWLPGDDWRVGRWCDWRQPGVGRLGGV